MSTALISRLAKVTLQQSRPRWIATTSYLLSSAKASTAAAAPALGNNNNSSSAAAAAAAAPLPASNRGSDDPEIPAKGGSIDNPTDSSTAGNPTKGRKITRKSRRSQHVIPKSFLDSNYLRHQTLRTPTIPSSYSEPIPDYLWEELRLVVEAGLAPKGTLAAFNHSDHIVLNVPGRGATYLQDAIAKQLAVDVGADLVVFDAQDFIALAQSGDSNVMTLLPSMSSSDTGASAVLAIRPNNTASNSNSAAAAATADSSKAEEQPAMFEYDSEQDALIGILERFGNRTSEEEKSDDNKTSSDPQAIAPKAMAEMTARYSAAFERMLQTGKEKGSSSSTASAAATATTPSQTPKLIYLRDYGDMHDLPSSLMLKALMMAIEHLKQKGHRLVVLAGYSPTLASTHVNYKLALEEHEIPLLSSMKCISIPPPLNDRVLLDAWESQMRMDTARRMGEINAKQILAILQQKNVTGIKNMLQGNSNNNNNNNTAALVTELSKLEGIQESVWTGIEIERHVTFAIGHALRHKKSAVDLEDMVAANSVVRKSVSARRQLDKTLELQRVRLVAAGSSGSNDGGADLDMAELKKHCDEYEQRFLSRIVDPSKVQVSFAEIRAPSATIETLQTLITLPLVRPDLFRRGILKNNFIPGVLLFGPPGTGKTMLAKAVCKAGGSRMLEVQASDIYEMYLGEGEKNVKALFSLARKISPAVIFIDEVDSIMSRRRSDSTTNAHREIINQFMVEWEGLASDNQGVIVMAATNRPADLDDAILRRMPRRILVDLPKEEDRAEILNMLLRDEEGHLVSVAELARATEHYSGSDLKNLCVTAALKAAQKEAATQKKQTLGQAHFDEALKLVRPSSSEEMDSIKEIRKWASQYGDGGTKRKQQSIGFSH
ncbi:hypothetical protein BDB00DRAFT_124335 [Zychaea mexicana]|uniref:uncharacterized protein n=1 Tax=Zychaea mexicana TaxID=64656 RepID=UPI0022FE86D7|nr:uncharacterized protein BDB00DRAFT_124335 [Zychaea mexicana]KAI9496558.1 hypothetical protein BDB00DRAFT_124335 [Zychaea mexicana]